MATLAVVVRLTAAKRHVTGSNAQSFVPGGGVGPEQVVEHELTSGQALPFIEPCSQFFGPIVVGKLPVLPSGTLPSPQPVPPLEFPLVRVTHSRAPCLLPAKRKAQNGSEDAR